MKELRLDLNVSLAFQPLSKADSKISLISCFCGFTAKDHELEDMMSPSPRGAAGVYEFIKHRLLHHMIPDSVTAETGAGICLQRDDRNALLTLKLNRVSG